MTAFTFTKAVKQQEKLRLALDGPAGSGKTWTALIIATDLAQREGGRVAVIDSERSSARKYASEFDFDHLTLPDWSPHTYMGAVRAAEEAGYTVIVIDSFSHAWEGVLELKDNATARSKSKNSFTEGWREATPVHNELVDTVLRADAHVIATLRTKTEYVIGDDKSITKVGLAPIQRAGVDFEFDVVGDMTAENSMVISKTRCSALAGVVIRKPDKRLAETLWNWLTDGEPPIGSADAQRLAQALNAKGKAARAAWLERFGVPPKALIASRIAEADAFVAGLPDESHGGNGARPGDASDREAEGGDTGPSQSPGPSNEKDVTDGGAVAAGAGTGGGSATPAGTPADTVGWKDVGVLATRVFKAAYDAAPNRQKARTVDRLRHALIYACTDGATGSAKACTAEQLFKVRNTLEAIGRGEITYRYDLGDDRGVTWVSASGKERTVLWAESEMADTDTEGAAA
jgi:hypothetical protein